MVGLEALGESEYINLDGPDVLDGDWKGTLLTGNCSSSCSRGTSRPHENSTFVRSGRLPPEAPCEGSGGLWNWPTLSGVCVCVGRGGMWSDDNISELF